MDRATAFGVLGLTGGAPWPEVRATYLRLVREHHPDSAGDLEDAGRRTVRTAQITEAYAWLLAGRALPPEDPAGVRVAPWTVRDVLEDTRRVLLDASMPDAFAALLEVAHVIGVVSYVDRESAVLETIVTAAPRQATSLLVYLEPGETAQITEAVLGVEPLGAHEPAPLDGLVERIATLLAAPRPVRGDP